MRKSWRFTNAIFNLLLFCYPARTSQTILNQNIYKTDPETGLLDPSAVFWINMVVWTALPLYSLLAIADLTQAAWMTYFFIFRLWFISFLGSSANGF